MEISVYLRILVDELTSRLHLCVWFSNPEELEGIIVYRSNTINFGDSQAALVIHILQQKYLSRLVKLEISRYIILNCSYADNYSSSLPQQWMFRRVKEDLIQAHEILTMPLKNCHSNNETYEGIGLVYQFLGILWNLENDTISPNSYQRVGRKVRRKREEVLLKELPDEVIDSL